MAVTKSNGVSGRERRRKSRAIGPADPVGAVDVQEDASTWLGRIDALADRLASLEDRGSIVDDVVSETMRLLPADEVVVRSDAAAVTVASFTDASDEAPARAVIPLVIGGRHFGAVEIAMKSRRAVGPAERTLSIALARQCALALDGLAMRRAQRDAVRPETATPAGGQHESTLAEIAPAEIAPAEMRTAGGPPPARDRAAELALLGRLEGDLRGLAKLARSAELPPTIWVDQAERAVLRRLEELRAQLLGPALAGPTDAA
jgi:hypothetical protein